MLEIEKEQLFVKTQTLEVIGFRMIKNQDWQGEVEYEIRTEKEKVVERGAIPIPDWNTFWAGFNSGSYLYDFTVKALNFNVELPNLENDFTN